MDRVVIEGGLARLERVETVVQAPLEAMQQYLVKPLSLVLPTLPSHATRYAYFSDKENRGLLLVETAPRLVNMRVFHSIENRGRFTDDADRGDEPGEDIGRTGNVGVWKVQVPWQYFAFPFRTNTGGNGIMTDFTIDNTLLYWAKDQYVDETTQLQPAPAPNIDKNGRICYGQTRAENTSLARRIDDYVNNWFTTTFNDHLGHVTPFGHSLTEWEQNSPGDLSWREWDIWENPPQGPYITVKQIPEGPWRAMERTYDPAIPERPEAAQMAPAFVDLPDPPETFTVARARQYFLDVPEPARSRLLMAAITLAAERTAAGEEVAV